jgi:hypothetical protein
MSEALLDRNNYLRKFARTHLKYRVLEVFCRFMIVLELFDREFPELDKRQSITNDYSSPYQSEQVI